MEITGLKTFVIGSGWQNQPSAVVWPGRPAETCVQCGD